MITQAMILAAGKGTRMRPLTLNTPKPLISVADKPLIVWHIERLRDAGISDITVNVGYLGAVLKDALLNMDMGVNIHISDECVFSEPLETAGGIRYALDNGCLQDKPFILVNGDVWTTFDFGTLARCELGENLAHLLLVDNPEHNPLGDFVLQTADNKVQIKEVGQGECLTFAGLSVLSPRLVDKVAQEPTPLAPLLKSAMTKGQITGKKLGSDTTWVDVGTLERLAWVNDFVKNHKK